ncbi:RNA methyltransferase [bacterium]|nr:RNA methyltransferase [bacterium]
MHDLPRHPLNVVVDNIRSLDNVGLIFRLCELARVEHLYLTGYTGYPRRDDDPREEAIIARHEHRILKTAVYAVPFQPWSYVEDPVALVQLQKEEGHQIVALEQTDTSVSYHQANYEAPVTLVVGHEREGVRQELIDIADLTIEIPVYGLGNSHNVATATGIVLYRILDKIGRI